MGVSLLSNLLKDAYFLSKGAEADLYVVNFENMKSILKIRKKKMYRIHEIDRVIRRNRTYNEASMLYTLNTNHYPSPQLYYANLNESYIIMEYISGQRIKEAIKLMSIEEISAVGLSIGRMIGWLHNLNIVHNDLTTSNFIIKNIDKNKLMIYLIDYGLSMRSYSFKDKAVDIDIFNRVLVSTHPDISRSFFSSFIKGYRETSKEYESVIRFYNKLSRMGRYHERGS